MLPFIKKIQKKQRIQARKKVVFFSVMSGLISAGVALVFAPKSGKETRAEIAKKATEAKEKAGVNFERIKGEVGTKTQDLRSKAQEATQKLTSNIKAKFQKKEEELEETDK